MGYDIQMVGKNNHVLKVKPFSEGGTRRMDQPETEAWVSVTYNYAKFYYSTIDSQKGIRWIYGKTGKECIERLKYSLSILGTLKEDDYWTPTSGNAGCIIALLLSWCEQKPDGIFRGD